MMKLAVVMESHQLRQKAYISPLLFVKYLSYTAILFDIVSEVYKIIVLVKQLNIVMLQHLFVLQPAVALSNIKT